MQIWYKSKQSYRIAPVLFSSLLEGQRQYYHLGGILKEDALHRGHSQHNNRPHHTLDSTLIFAIQGQFYSAL